MTLRPAARAKRGRGPAASSSALAWRWTSHASSLAGAPTRGRGSDTAAECPDTGGAPPRPPHLAASKSWSWAVPVSSRALGGFGSRHKFKHRQRDRGAFLASSASASPMLSWHCKAWQRVRARQRRPRSCAQRYRSKARSNAACDRNARSSVSPAPSCCSCEMFRFRHSPACLFPIPAAAAARRWLASAAAAPDAEPSPPAARRSERLHAARVASCRQCIRRGSQCCTLQCYARRTRARRPRAGQRAGYVIAQLQCHADRLPNHRTGARQQAAPCAQFRSNETRARNLCAMHAR